MLHVYKVGCRVKFAHDTWSILFNGEVNISSLTGTVVQNDYLDEDAAKTFAPSIWIKMDKHLPGYEEWDNCIQFTANGDGGTDMEYLLNAEFIK